MMDDGFEWDDEKAAANHAKHGIMFEQAKGVFRDPFAIEFLDDRHDYGEDRYILIGMTEARILTVVHVERNERVRIISARLAGPHERKRYLEENGWS